MISISFKPLGVRTEFCIEKKNFYKYFIFQTDRNITEFKYEFIYVNIVWFKTSLE
jgi:hypothetical protein